MTNNKAVVKSNENSDVTKIKKGDVQAFLKSDEVQQRLQQLLNKRAPQFMASLMSIINTNAKLKECTPHTVLSSAITAASLDLPINPNLGFAYIIPYNNKVKVQEEVKKADGSSLTKTVEKWQMEAQFQIGYKGFIQLAQRSGQYRTIATTEVYEGQLISQDPLRGNIYDFTEESKQSDKVIGFAALFVLQNGFEKDLYMSNEEMKAHGIKYSKSFKKGYGLWKDEFDVMGKKTVLKLLLSKFGPMSTAMQEAMVADQAIGGEEGNYADNEKPDPEKADPEKVKADAAKAMEDLANNKTEEADDPHKDEPKE